MRFGGRRRGDPVGRLAVWGVPEWPEASLGVGVNQNQNFVRSQLPKLKTMPFELTTRSSRFRALPNWARLLIVACAVSWSWSCHATASAQESDEENRPLIEQEPFDLITLDRTNQFEVLKVVPIQETAVTLNVDVPQRPFDFEDRSTLKFELRDVPDMYWQVPWNNITKIELFPELVLQEAKRLLREGDYDLCFRTLLHLRNSLGMQDSVEVKQLFQQCMIEEGLELINNRRFDEALAVFMELARANVNVPGRRSATDIVGDIYDNMVMERVDAGNYRKAQEIVGIVRNRYGDLMRDRLEKWNELIDRAAVQELERVRQVLAGGDADAVHRSVRNLVYVMPHLREGHEMLQSVMREFPFIYVGVTQFPQEAETSLVNAGSSQFRSQADPSDMFNWAERRVGRLVKRWLIEFDGLSDEGGDYSFPNGRISRIDELGLRYRITIQPDKWGYAVPPISTYEISNRLLDLARDDSPDYYIPWARLLKTVEIENDRSVVFELREPYVRPEALLQVAYHRSDSEHYLEANGKYEQFRYEAEFREAHYRPNSRYEAPPDRQMPLIIERKFKAASEADEALIRGDIDVVDRIYPANYNRLKRDPNIQVKPYGIPTVHLLVPNQERTLHMKNVTFRRGLLYSLDRETLIHEFIAGGRDISGFENISGPFPPGSDNSDQIAYAYENRILPVPYNGKIGLVAPKMVEELEKDRIRREREKEKSMSLEAPEDVTGEVDEDGNPKEEEIIVERPVFILVHPDNELIENLCGAMARYWEYVGVEVELKKLPPGERFPSEDMEWDLLYLECFFKEPMVDAYELFGPGGLVENVDPTIRQALRMLDQATSWAKVAKSLRRVHQQTSNNMTIMPLWQIMDHYAYRNRVDHVGSDIVHLYQNVESWNIEHMIPKRFDDLTTPR